MIKPAAQPALDASACSASEDGEIDDYPCWCGETRPYYARLPSRCGGYGYINCICGGDFCVCHWHGEVECFGCPDCDEDD